MKTALLTVLTLFPFFTAKAQVSFSHSGGLSFYWAGQAASYSVLYSPRLNLLEFGDEATFSIGTHLGGWVSLSSRGSSDDAYVLDVPIMAEVNFGQGAYSDTRGSFGGFAGVGYGVSFVGSSNSLGGGASENMATGPVANIGIRTLISGQAVGLRLSYLYNLNSNGDSDVFGLGLFYTFGDF